MTHLLRLRSKYLPRMEKGCFGILFLCCRQKKNASPSRALAVTQRLMILLLAGVAALIGSADGRLIHPAVSKLPPQMVWAWERPEDLRWLPDDVGVAYLAVSIELRGSKTVVRPRRPPVLMRDHTAQVPVIHVDPLWHPSPRLTPAQREVIVAQVLGAVPRANRGVVQLDFEARRSQRVFLAEVVEQIRQRLPREIALSMTALASWCAEDYWLADLPADEIVPMAFRMGADDRAVRAQLARRGRFFRQRCAAAIGSATDEVSIPGRALRHYHFSPAAWTPELWSRTAP